MEKWDGKFLKKVGQLCDDRPDSHFVSVRTGEKNTYMILGSDNDVLIVFVCLPVCLSACHCSVVCARLSLIPFTYLSINININNTINRNKTLS